MSRAFTQVIPFPRIFSRQSRYRESCQRCQEQGAIPRTCQRCHGFPKYRIEGVTKKFYVVFTPIREIQEELLSLLPMKK